MKILPVLGAILMLSIFFCISSGISSCTKDHTNYDTTTVTIHDSTTIRDTTILKDSIYDLKFGLVAYYSFNNGSLTDSSGYNNNIIFNNATLTTDRFGNSNNAYLFNGSNSYMKVANSPSLNPNEITIYAIVKVNGFYMGTCDANQIVIKGPAYQTDGFYQLTILDPSYSCGIGTPNFNNETFAGAYGDDLPEGAAAGLSGTAPINIGTWYSVAFTYDGLTAKMYIDGVLKNTIQKIVPFTANSNDVYIGKTENTTYPYYFNGIIDEVRIYNKALSPNEINYLYKTGN